MIVIHEMAAPHDLIGIHIRRGDSMYHVLSDLPRPKGTAELLLFMRRCGAKDTWMQATGTYREHYDVFGELSDRVRSFGAIPANNAEVATILTNKRRADPATDIAIPNVTAFQMNGLMYELIDTGVMTEAELVTLAADRVVQCALQLLQVQHTASTITVYAGPGVTGAVAKAAVHALRQNGATVIVITQTDPLPTLETVATTDLIIDGILGSGIEGSPTGFCRDAINQIIQLRKPTIAIDLPSGLGGNEAFGYMPIVPATTTLALGLPKRGVLLESAAAYIGDLWLADVGFTSRQLKHMSVRMDNSVFADAPIVRLSRRPLAEGVPGFTSPYCRWVVDDDIARRQVDEPTYRV